MENVNVYSPIEDKGIAKNLNGSPIWTNCYHEDDLIMAKNKHNILYCYTIKFDGTKPIMVNKISKVSK